MGSDAASLRQCCAYRITGGLGTVEGRPQGRRVGKKEVEGYKRSGQENFGRD